MLLNKDRKQLQKSIDIINKIRVHIPAQDINNITHEKFVYIQSCYDCVDYLNIVIEGY